MKNIRIKQIRDNYYQVIADTERFGKQEIIFEGISYEECAKFIKENTKFQKKALWAVQVKPECQDATFSWVVVRSKDSWTAFKQVWNKGYNNGYRFYEQIKIQEEA